MFRRPIEIKILNPLLGSTMPLPAYETEGSAGMDLRACIAGEVTIEPGGRKLIGTGLAINIQDPTLVAIIGGMPG